MSTGDFVVVDEPASAWAAKIADHGHLWYTEKFDISSFGSSPEYILGETKCFACGITNKLASYNDQIEAAIDDFLEE